MGILKNPCGQHDFLDFSDDCIRRGWATLLPVAATVALCICYIPLPNVVKKAMKHISAPFEPFLTLEEAEALDAQPIPDDPRVNLKMRAVFPLWRSVVFAFAGTLESLACITIGVYFLFSDGFDRWMSILQLLTALPWLYTAIRSIVHPSATPPYDILLLYLSMMLGGILHTGGYVVDHIVLGKSSPMKSLIIIESIGLSILLGLLILLFDMPLAIPSNRVKKSDIGVTLSAEDYTTLSKWILAFNWVYPLIKLGRNTTLQEKDVWNLSFTMRSRPLFIMFSEIKQSKLLRLIWIANSRDLLLDFILTYVMVVFSYASPFFLKRILDAIAIENPTPASRTNAYIYAFLAFACTIIKSIADTQHLWHGRRAAFRIRSSLMASIYDKALKRKDYSGIIDKDKKEEAAEAKKRKQSSTGEVNDKGKAATKNDAKGGGKGKGGKNEPRAGANVGKIVNLMSGDSNRIANTAATIPILYGAPLEIAVAGIFLYQILGVSAFAGFGALLLGWPLSRFLSKRAIQITKGIVTAKDKRMGVINELIHAIKFIKFFAWEDRWIDRAMEAREKEIKWIIKSRLNQIMLTTLWSLGSIFISIISFLVYVELGNELTASTAFTAIALFGMVRGPLKAIPTNLVQILQTMVVVKRVEVYLGEEEVSEQISSLKHDSSRPVETTGLGLENATLRWNEVPDEKAIARAGDASANESEPTINAERVGHRFELQDITIRFPEGKLTLVTGPTASGKTALLMGVLGELTTVKGTIVIYKDPSKVDEHGNMHCISYVSQTPWIRHQNIRENIIFGYPFDQERYEAVLDACALNPDLAIFEDGDATEIGVKGVNLSGGQKARVALARALYAHNKYVLLDDPLSAVDSHTARILYEKVLLGPLLANRTVVLVTHHVDLVLPGAYYYVRMVDGRIATQGTVEDLRNIGEFNDVVQTMSENRFEAIEPALESKEAADDGAKLSDLQENVKKPKKLVKDEHRAEGKVKWSVYKAYVKASSYWIWAFLFFIVCANQVISVGEKLWIKTWGEAYLDHEFKYTWKTSQTVLAGIKWPSANVHPLFYVAIYAAITISTALSGTLSATAQYTGALRASRILFKQMLVSVIHATFRFHDTTPQGRMLNRFGKDFDTVDSALAGSLQNANTALANLFASIITVAVIFPSFLIPAFFIGLGYYEFGIGYLNTARDLRRMGANTRSPIYSDFGEVLDGIVTVRAFSLEKLFLDNIHRKIDTSTKMSYMFWMTNRWLLANYNIFGAFVVLIVTLFSVTSLRSAGLAGLCITSAISFTTSVYWACRYWTTLEIDLNCVERIVEYLDLPQDPPAIIESSRVPAYWPSFKKDHPLIVVENLVVKYASDLPPVIRGISFTLIAGERVGLLGRTGSGKSTLAMSFLRFMDPTSGQILIDGIDISTIGVRDLRSRLTFIPQDATLFSGTLRDNLDPFHEHEDSECLEVLYKVHLIARSENVGTSTTTMSRNESSLELDTPAMIDSLSVTAAAVDTDTKSVVDLDTQVSAGGTNVSQGQRQLIAMARALLRQSSIIIFDEATSSIDFATDTKIQSTIRESFNNSLLITVAHRIRTVIDYDRLIILDNGLIAEFDTPWNLIRKEDGIFRNMCLKSGSFAELEAAAKSKAVPQ